MRGQIVRSTIDYCCGFLLDHGVRTCSGFHSSVEGMGGKRGWNRASRRGHHNDVDVRPLDLIPELCRWLTQSLYLSRLGLAGPAISAEAGLCGNDCVAVWTDSSVNSRGRLLIASATDKVGC
jgi:hypothetical protein